MASRARKEAVILIGDLKIAQNTEAFVESEQHLVLPVSHVP